MDFKEAYKQIIRKLIPLPRPSIISHNYIADCDIGIWLGKDEQSKILNNIIKGKHIGVKTE